MPDSSPVTRLEDIDAAWMTRFVRDLGYAVRVESVQSQSIGTGQSAHSERFLLTYAELDTRAPASFVGKFPSPDPTSRQTGNMGSYVREVSFYRYIKPTVKVATPAVHRLRAGLRQLPGVPRRQSSKLRRTGPAERRVRRRDGRLHAHDGGHGSCHPG